MATSPTSLAMISLGGGPGCPRVISAGDASTATDQTAVRVTSLGGPTVGVVPEVAPLISPLFQHHHHLDQSTPLASVSYPNTHYVAHYAGTSVSYVPSSSLSFSPPPPLNTHSVSHPLHQQQSHTPNQHSPNQYQQLQLLPPISSQQSLVSPLQRLEMEEQPQRVHQQTNI